MLDYGAKGDVEAALTCAFVADVVHDLVTRLAGREALLGRRAGAAATPPTPSSATYRDPDFLASLADAPGPRHLDADFEMVQDTFRSLRRQRDRPVAEHVHRDQRRRARGDHRRPRRDGRVRAVACPAEYGGYSEGGEREYLGMVVATEELVAGSARASAAR